MLMNQQLEDGNYVGSEQINNSSEEGPTGLSPSIKKELEVHMIRTFKQSIMPILEPMIATFSSLSRCCTCFQLNEEMRSAVDKMLTAMKQNSGIEIHPTEQISFQLRFFNEVSPQVMTKDQIQGAKGDPIKVELVDVRTGLVVNYKPLASAMVEIVVLKGDFDDDNMMLEEFNQNIVTELEGQRSLLKGNTVLTLTEGVGILDDISFKQNSVWRKRCELRLGARVVGNNPNGTRVREAKTKRFNLMDRRNKRYKKSNPTSLDDEVWRLESIGSVFRKRLTEKGIKTVKDFLVEYNNDPKRLQNILQAPDKVWNTMVKHALTCIPDKTLNLCPPPNCQSTNFVGKVVGTLSESQYVRSDGLPDTDKANAQQLAVAAYGHLDVFAEISSNFSQWEMHSGNLTIAENPSHLSQWEISSGSNSLTVDDFCPPSTSYGAANGFHDCSFHGLENNQSQSLPVQFTNSSFGVSEYSTQPTLCQESFIDLFVNNQNLNLESQGNVQSVVDGAMQKAQRKRTKSSEVLLRFISLQVVTLKRIRAAKRPRLC